MSTDGRELLLISAPWRTPEHGNIAVATLKPILEREGIATDVLYGSLLYPRTSSGPPPDDELDESWRGTAGATTSSWFSAA